PRQHRVGDEYRLGHQYCVGHRPARPVAATRERLVRLVSEPGERRPVDRLAIRRLARPSRKVLRLRSWGVLMEKLQSHVEPERASVNSFVDEGLPRHWQRRLPQLNGHRVRLREITESDAPSLFTSLASEEITRFVSAPPATVEGFEAFATWARS